MMLIPQHPGLGTVESLKTPYYVDPSGSPPSVVASVSTAATGGNGAQTVFSYSAGDGCVIPGRMQSELPGLNMYGPQPGSSALASPTNYGAVPPAVAAAPGLMTPHYAGTAIEHSPYYPSLGPNYEMKPGGGDMWAGGYPQPAPGYYPYDNTFGPQYPYDRYCSMDMNDGVRRKNATRESTNTLKSWLQEHKKNPYPTKGEKIMLAIITKMTLTQVSTWFANARRRLKKENKMTWVPKNRSNENGSGSAEKKEDGEDEDGQNIDPDNRSDQDAGVDSDDSAEREVTSTNNNELASNYSHENSAFDEERVAEPYSAGDPSSAEKPGHAFPAPQPGDPEYKAAGNLACEAGQARFGHAEVPNRAIWSPVNEQPRPAYPLHPQDRLDVGREHESAVYANAAAAAAAAGGQFQDGYVTVGRQAPIVSPGMIRDSDAAARPGTEYHYPAAQHQPWPTEHGFPNALPSSSEACGIGHPGSGGESTEGRSDAQEIVAGSPSSQAEYQQQHYAYQRAAAAGEHYLPMYPVGRARDIPGNSPYAQNGGDFYQQQRDRLPPPPALGAPYYREASERLQTTNPYAHSDATGTPLEAATSPSSASVSPPAARALYHTHRGQGAVPGGTYYGQAASVSPMYQSSYYPQEGAPHMGLTPHLATSMHDVAAKLSPSVTQNAYTRSPGSKSPAVEIGASPNGRCDVPAEMPNRATR